MSQSKHKDKKTQRLRHEVRIGGTLPGRNISEKSEIEQTRIENRREADLEDKTPSGDGGVEDNNPDQETSDAIAESNY